MTEGTAIDEAVMVKFQACDKIVFGEGFHLPPGAEMVATVKENCKTVAMQPKVWTCKEQALPLDPIHSRTKQQPL